MKKRNMILEDEIEDMNNEINKIETELENLRKTSIRLLCTILSIELFILGYQFGKKQLEHKVLDSTEEDKLIDIKDLTINDDMTLNDNVVKVKKLTK